MRAIELHSINRWEASFLREEVGGYFTHGIECTPGATVLDVGANIGVFSAAVYERLDGDVRIYAFEPMPPLHATLERNAREFFNGRLIRAPLRPGVPRRRARFQLHSGRHDLLVLLAGSGEHRG
ncbi:FkbM family methyltransferase [Streptomyces sp. GLT-R25]